MPRPQKRRKSHYKGYYDKSSADSAIPESTLRSLKKPRTENAHDDVSSEDSDHDGPQSDHEPIAPQIQDNYARLNAPDQDQSSVATDTSNECGEREDSLINQEDQVPTQHLARESHGSGDDWDPGDDHEGEHLVDSQGHASASAGDERVEHVEEDQTDSNYSMDQDQSSVATDTSNECGEREDSLINQEDQVPTQHLARESHGSGDDWDPDDDHEGEHLVDSQSHASASAGDEREEHVEEDQTDSNYSMNEIGNLDPNYNESSASSSLNTAHSDESQNSYSGNDEEEDLGNAQNNCRDNVLNDPFGRLKDSFQGFFKTEMNLNVKISVGEIMTSALTLSRKHNWNHLEKSHLLKFVKSILGCENLPDSRYLLDEYLYSKEDMRYYFFCRECSKSLGDFAAKEVRPDNIACPSCQCVCIVSDLSKATFFVTFYVPSQIEVLFSDPNIRRKLVSPTEFVNPPADGLMTDLYHGTMYRQFANYVVNNVPPNIKCISLTASLDSASICSFSGLKICPCFCMINELPDVLRTANPLLLGLWFGVDKEKVDLFLPPIVDHMAELSRQGFTLSFDEEDNWNMRAYTIAFCADSVARCDCQGIHGHRGDYPCSWCLEEGEEYEDESEAKVRIFRWTEQLSPPRTMEELIEDSQKALRTKQFVNGVKYLSPLSGAPLFDIVNSFIVDAMHARDEGTTKAFLKSWLGEEGRGEFNIGSADNVRKINARLKQVKPPKEVRKYARDLKHLAFWTAREFENWGLFLSVPVLENILHDRYLKHWALYVQVNFILLSSKIPVGAIDIAENLTEEFCSRTEGLYNPKMMRFNLHILRHLPANSRRWGPSYALSAYGFEAGNQKLKKLVHGGRYLPNQICRGLSEDNALILLRKHCSSNRTNTFEQSISSKTGGVEIELPGKIKLLHKSKAFNATGEESWFIEQMGLETKDFSLFTELSKNGCCYRYSDKQRRSDNTYARLTNKKFIHIRKILYQQSKNEAWVVASLVRCEPSRFCPPSVVQFDRDLCFQYSIISIDDDIEFYKASELDNICVRFMFNHGQYLSPMPNIFNTQ